MWHLLRQHISYGNIYLLQQHISYSNISPPATYLFQQHISSGNISPPATYLLQQHIVFPTAPFQQSSFHSFRLTASLIVHPTTALWGVGKFLHPLIPSACTHYATNLSLLHSPCSRREGGQGLCLSFPVTFHAETQSSNFSWAYQALYTKCK